MIVELLTDVNYHFSSDHIAVVCFCLFWWHYTRYLTCCCMW